MQAHFDVPSLKGRNDVSDTAGVYDPLTKRGMFISTEPDGPCEQINDGAVAYLKGLCAGARDPSETKTWIEVSAADATTSFGSGGVNNVLLTLQQFTADIEVVGHEAIRGVSTTHYRARLPMTSSSSVAAAQSGPPGAVIDVWIDKQGRLRRAVEHETSPLSPATTDFPSGPSFISVDLYDFGVKVNVLDPPADQVDDQVAPQPVGASSQSEVAVNNGTA